MKKRFIKYIVITIVIIFSISGCYTNIPDDLEIIYPPEAILAYKHSLTITNVYNNEIHNLINDKTYNIIERKQNNVVLVNENDEPIKINGENIIL
jgi:hypothetical protein